MGVTMNRIKIFALFGPLCLLLSLSGASAQEATEAPPAEEPAPAGVNEQAKALYLDGRKAFNVGEFQTAVDKFTEAYDLSKKPALLYNIAFAHDKAGDEKKAIFFYERFLAEDPEAPADRQKEVGTRVEQLKQDRAKMDEAA